MGELADNSPQAIEPLYPHFKKSKYLINASSFLHACIRPAGHEEWGHAHSVWGRVRGCQRMALRTEARRRVVEPQTALSATSLSSGHPIAVCFMPIEINMGSSEAVTNVTLLSADDTRC